MENDRKQPLPIVQRETMVRALFSFDGNHLQRAKDSGIPLYDWLSQFGNDFLTGGFLCRLALFNEAQLQGQVLADITQGTLDEFTRSLSERQGKLLQLNIGTIEEIPPELAPPSFAVWKPENSDLMDFLAMELPEGLARGGYTPPEIGAIQAGALSTYEISRIQAAKLT